MIAKFNKYFIYNDDNAIELLNLYNNISKLSLMSINKLYSLLTVINILTSNPYEGNDDRDIISEIKTQLDNINYIPEEGSIYRSSEIYDENNDISDSVNVLTNKVKNLLDIYGQNNKINYIYDNTINSFNKLRNIINDKINEIYESNSEISNNYQSLMNSINDIINNSGQNIDDEVKDLVNDISLDFYDSDDIYNIYKQKLYGILNITESNNIISNDSYIINVGEDPEKELINKLLNEINNLYGNIVSEDYIRAIEVYNSIISEFINSDNTNKTESFNTIKDNYLSNENDQVISFVNNFISTISFDDEYTYVNDDKEIINNDINSLTEIINSINSNNDNVVSQINSKIDEYNSLVIEYNSKHTEQFDTIEFDENRDKQNYYNGVNDKVNEINLVLSSIIPEVNELIVTSDKTDVYPDDNIVISISYLPQNHKILNIDNLSIEYDDNSFELIDKSLYEVTLKAIGNNYGNYTINIRYNEVIANVSVNINENVQPDTMYFYYGNNDSILNRNVNEEPISINYDICESVTESELFNVEDGQNKYKLLNGSITEPIKYLLIKSSYVDNNNLYIRPDSIDSPYTLSETTIYKDNEYTLLVFPDYGHGLIADQRLCLGEYSESIIGQLVELVELTNNEPVNYYWYVGTTVPTDPTNTTQNTGNNEWTSLGTNLSTSDIQINKVDTSYNPSTWYIAAPSVANFTLYNATNVASDEATWNKTTFNVGSVQYTLWTSKYTSYQAVEYLHK